MKTSHHDARRPGRAAWTASAGVALSALGGLSLVTPAQAEVSRPMLLAQQPNSHCQGPRWSPDGLQVAYDMHNPKADTRTTWIVKLTPDGRTAGAPREVKVSKLTGSAALGGKKPPVVDFEWAPRMDLLTEPYVVSSRGAKKNFDLFADDTWLTENPGNDGQPAWSSDGRFIAYTAQQRDSGDVVVLDLQGDASPRRLTTWTDATEYGARWAPAGHRLAFIKSVSGNKGADIGVIGDVVKPRETTRMLTDWNGDEIRPSWSPDGEWVAFYANKGRSRKDDKIFDLWVVDREGQNARKLAKDVVVDEHRGPAWSPDSRTVLYVKRDFNKNNPVKWVRADGSAQGTLKTNTQLNSDLALFPLGGDKMRLAFRALGEKGSANKTWQRLYMVTLTTADLTEGE